MHCARLASPAAALRDSRDTSASNRHIDLAHLPRLRGRQVLCPVALEQIAIQPQPNEPRPTLTMLKLRQRIALAAASVSALALMAIAAPSIQAQDKPAETPPAAA